jgi:hypothetical protein
MRATWYVSAVRTGRHDRLGSELVMERGRDEGVFLSVICAGFAWMSAVKFPSVAMNLVLILMIGWAFWSIYKMSLDRL